MTSYIFLLKIYREVLFRKNSIVNFLCLIIFFPVISNAQLSNPTFINKGSLNNVPGVSLLVQSIQNPCGNSVGLGKKKTIFRLKLSGLKNRYSNSDSKFILNLKLNIEECSGRTTTKNFSINLGKLDKEGEIKNDKEWYYEGSKVISFGGAIQEIKTTPFCENILPSEIFTSKEDEIYSGESIILSVSSDGYLCQNAQWEWLEGDCNDFNRIDMNRNSSIVITPSATTTYYLRIRDKNKTSECMSKTVYVSQRPEVEKKIEPVRMPISISGTPDEDVCPNTSIDLFVKGGLENNQNEWVWKKNSCDGEIIGRGNRLNLQAVQSTSIFVQDENDSLSECKKVSILVKKIEPVIDPIINNDMASVSICLGATTSLIVSNFSKDAQYQMRWYDNQNRTLNINSKSIDVSPIIDTKYYVRNEGICNSYSKTSVIEVKVIRKSSPPYSVIENKVKGKTYKFTVTGGELEPGANWKWYEDNGCGNSETIGVGNEIITKIKKIKSLSVRAEGGNCGFSDCYNHQIINKKKQTKFGFINAGIFNDNFNNLNLTIGSKRVYLRYTTCINKINVPYEITFSDLYGYTIPDLSSQSNIAYNFNGEISYKRMGYTGGFMLGGRNIRLYIGGGVGEVVTQWGVDVIQNSLKTVSWGAVQNKKFSGIQAEAGLFIKLGFVNLMGGINVIKDETNGYYIDGTAGLGFTF